MTSNICYTAPTEAHAQLVSSELSTLSKLIMDMAGI